jgi:phosphate transport system permease protein
MDSESLEAPWTAARSALRPTAPRRRNVGDRVFRILAASFAFTLLIVVASIFLVLCYQSRDAVRTFRWAFLTTSVWDPVAREFGALPLIYGTLVSSLLALAQAIPLSVGTALFLSELAPPWVRAPVSFLVELLATIPSVVYGLWGIFVLVPWMRSYIGPALSGTLGFLPTFSGPNYGVGMLTASMILAVMIVPYITSVAHEVFQAVPAVMLGLGRAIGETMAVTMVIGNRADVSLSVFAPASTMASIIANEFTEATYDLYVQALVEVGLVLLVVTVVVNVFARLLVWRVAAPAGGAR